MLADLATLGLPAGNGGSSVDFFLREGRAYYCGFTELMLGMSRLINSSSRKAGPLRVARKLLFTIFRDDGCGMSFLRCLDRP